MVQESKGTMALLINRMTAVFVGATVKRGWIPGIAGADAAVERVRRRPALPASSPRNAATFAQAAA